MIKQPHLNAQYNSSMGGVDLVDKPGTSKTVWYLTNWKIQLAGLLWLDYSGWFFQQKGHMGVDTVN